MWLSRGDLRVETESEIIAAKYQVLQTKYYVEKMKTETDSKRRQCQKCDKTIDHIMSVYPVSAREKYKYSEMAVCAGLAFKGRR